MIYGKWNVSIDNKWRFLFPSAASCYFNNGKVILYESDDGCIRIEKFSRKKEVEGFAVCFMKYKMGVSKGRRILIPRQLRNSISFFFGKKVTVVGKGTYLELHPRK